MFPAILYSSDFDGEFPARQNPGRVLAPEQVLKSAARLPGRAASQCYAQS
jgi:hypothetical protein